MQGWEFAHSLIAHLLILLKSNEQLRAIRSDCSRQMSIEQPWANRLGRWEEMSDREQIAQVAQDKWATTSDSLKSLRGKEQMSASLKKCWLKKSKILF